jgi:hypothetical protein
MYLALLPHTGSLCSMSLKFVKKEVKTAFWNVEEEILKSSFGAVNQIRILIIALFS